MKKKITLNQLKELVKEARNPSSRDFVIKNGHLKEYNGNAKHVVIPDGVKIIDISSFHNSEIESVVIPDTVKEIWDEAFLECKELKSVTFGKGLKIIDNSSFGDCTSLTSIVIPDSVESIEDNAFYGCTNLSKVVLPKNVKLGKDCFKGTAWQKAKDAELRAKLGIELDHCKEMSRDEILEWIKQGGLCVFRRGLSFRGARQHPMSTEEALKKFPYYSFNNPTAELIWTIYNDGETFHVALEFCELDENDMFESRKITLTVGQIKRLIKENFYGGQAWKDTWEKMVLRYDREQDCYVPKDDFKDEVEGIVSILNTSPIFGPHYELTNNPFNSGTNKDNCRLVLDGGADWKTMKPFLDEFYGTDAYQAYKKGCPVSNTGYNKPRYKLTLWIDVNGEIPVFQINGKYPPKEMVPRLFANGQKDIDDMLHLLTRIADKVQEAAKDEDEEEHARRARDAFDQYSIDIERQYGKRYTGAYAKYNKWDESTKMTLTIGQIRRLIKESDEVKLQMVALKKAFDEVMRGGKKEASAGNWKIEALGDWNEEMGCLEHGGHWVYFKGVAILEVNYETMEYCFLAETAILTKEMIDAMLETLECKDFKLEGDEPDFLSGD